MCIAASLYLGHQQRKAAKTASRQAREASLQEREQMETERNLAASSQAKEAEAVDAGETGELSAAKRRRGVASTYLNQQLGE